VSEQHGSSPSGSDLEYAIGLPGTRERRANQRARRTVHLPPGRPANALSKIRAPSGSFAAGAGELENSSSAPARWIDVSGGARLDGGSGANDTWSTNLSSLNVASGRHHPTNWPTLPFAVRRPDRRAGSALPRRQTPGAGPAHRHDRARTYRRPARITSAGKTATFFRRSFPAAPP